MRHIKTHSIELKPGHYLVAIDRDEEYFFVAFDNILDGFTKNQIITEYKFNPSDHDLTKLGTITE